MKTREKAIKEIRQLCVLIGCSGVDRKTCEKEPHKCSIIMDIVIPKIMSEAR